MVAGDRERPKFEEMVFENPYSKPRDSQITMGAHGGGTIIDESP